LLRAASGAVRVDEVTAGLLDASFALGGDEEGLRLEGEREVGEIRRTLLGRETPFVGRDRELAIVSGVLAESANEPVARAALVTGARGSGRWRLRAELPRGLPRRTEVFMGRGDPARAGTPYGMIAHALRRAAGVLDGEPADVQQRKLRARTARHVAAADVI